MFNVSAQGDQQLDQNQLSIILGVAAGVIQLTGYIVYLKVTKQANTGSWAIWTFGAILDLVSYIVLTGDWVKNILPAVCAFACIYTFGYMLWKRRFGSPDAVDWTFFVLDSVITVVWWRWATVVFANLLYQVSTLLSFVPMIRGQLRGTEKEHPFPWFIWTLAYGLFTASVALRLERWEELAYPVVHVVTHLAVMVIAVIKLRPSR